MARIPKTKPTMVQKVILSDLARFRLNELNDYVLKTWGEKALQTHLNKIKSRIQLIGNNPESGRLEFPRKKIRSIQASERIKIFYEIKEDHILVVNFFNTYKSPRKRLK